MTIAGISDTAPKMAEVHGNRTTAKNAGETGCSDESGAESGALGAQSGDFDPDLVDADLAKVIVAWPGLSADERAAVLRIVRAVGDP
jgi:hypothetical protein